jgi:hypothetical protein
MVRRKSIWLLTFPVAVMFAGCPCAGPPPMITCPNGPSHPQEDCSLAFNLDSTNIQGTLSAFNFLSTSGNVSTSAIRNVSSELTGYAIKRRDLCNEWNSCALDPQSYQALTVKLEDSINAATSQKDAAQAAAASGNAQAGVQAFNQVQAATSFTLEFAAHATLPQDLSQVPDKPCPHGTYAYKDPVVLGAGDTLPTGSHAWFEFASTAPVYVYLLQRTGATKELVKLFPDPRIPIPNPIPAGKWVRIPFKGTDAQGNDLDQSFCLDENDLGLDRVFIIASLNEIPSFDAAMQQIDSGTAKTIDQANPTLQAIDTLPTSTDQLPDSCVKSRGFVLDEGGQPPAAPAGPQTCPPKSRGFVLDSHASNPASKTSFAAMSDPGQNAMLVKVFPYNHAPKDAPPPAPAAARKRDIMIEQ